MADKKEKNVKKDKKPGFFARLFARIGKFCKDVVSEMKKVSWTPKTELGKNTKLVLATVIAFGVAIALVDYGSSFVFSSIAGLIGY